MKSIICLLFFTLFLCSCDPTIEQKDVYICTCQEKAKLQDFVKGSIKASNNMSDEEMEDVIRELRVTAIKIYCNQRTVSVIYKRDTREKILWELTPLDSCESFMDLY